MVKKKNTNPWTPKDEGSHYPITREWWTYETIFKTKEDKKKYNLMLIMAYNLEIPSCFFQYTLFNIDANKCIIREDIDDDIKKFIHKKNKLELKYKENFVKGLYPNYTLHLENKEKEFNIDIEFDAKSFPHWIAQDITNGELPIGLNFYKYGYIPNCDIKGNFKLKNKKYDLEGFGYVEHVWGDWSYQRPFKKFSNLKKTFSTYLNLGKWWLSEHNPKIPDKLKFASENNIFGYDWAWGVFDNSWSFFYGNILFWLSEGPGFGVFSLTKDGKKYLEFSDFNFKYNKVTYVKEYDIYFATDFEIFGRLKDEKIHLRFFIDKKSHEYIDPFQKQGFYKAFILSEMPAKVEGEYKDKNGIVKLCGDCKMMPLRQPSVLGHNALSFEFIKPPKGVGIKIDFNSHYLKKRIKTNLLLSPKLSFNFNVKKLKKEDFEF